MRNKPSKIHLIPILDIQTIEMLKDFNELVTTHGFFIKHPIIYNEYSSIFRTQQ
jgi:hypothetical protein